jgi:hypothetical protein
MFQSEIMSSKYILHRDVTISARLPVVHIPYIQGYAPKPILVDTLSIKLHLQ